MKKGTQIIKTPDHAHGDIFHPDSEKGFVAHATEINGALFCRYWAGANPMRLRTVANSELTPVANLTIADTVPQEAVNDALAAIDGFKTV